MRRASLIGDLVQGVIIGATGRVIAGLAIERARARGRRRPWRSVDGAMIPRPFTPLGALTRGMIAGATGSLMQTAFFRATARLAPPTPPGVFSPPEELQLEEQETETVARRVVEGLMRRGPIHNKRRAGEIVHYAFGASWGGLYGLIRGTTRTVATPMGVIAFATTVWFASDTLLLPAVQLAARPHAYPTKSHAYAWLAHVVYGTTVWAVFEAQRRTTWLPLVAALSARWATRGLPAPVRRPAARALSALRSQAIGARIRDAARDAAIGTMPRAA